MADEKPRKPKRTVEETVALWRAGVRIFVTNAAALFLFAGGAALILYFAIAGGDTGDERATDLFMAILPIAASIVSFWFAGRATSTNENQDKSRDVG